jgi:hypothetical protein
MKTAKTVYIKWLYLSTLLPGASEFVYMFTLEWGKWAQDWKEDVTLTGVCSFYFTSLQVEETEIDLTFETYFCCQKQSTFTHMGKYAALMLVVMKIEMGMQLLQISVVPELNQNMSSGLSC